MMRKIFVSYRRDPGRGDAGFTRALYHNLQSEFPAGDLFMDVEGKIKPGDDFVAVLTAQVAACDVLLAVIGPHWAELLAVRAGDPADFVVIEIKAALDQGKRVIPVLVGGAAMPRTEMLPEPIRELGGRNAVSLRHESFNTDCKVLVTALEEHFTSMERARAARVEDEHATAEAERRRRASEEEARRRAADALARSAASSEPMLRPSVFGWGLGSALIAGLVYWWLLAPPAPGPTPPPKEVPKINSEANAKKRKPDDGQAKAEDAPQNVVTVAPPPPKRQPTVGVFNPARAAVPLTLAEERALRPKDAFRECNVCPDMVVVPVGDFLMGSGPQEIAALKKAYPSDDLKRYDWEGPQHRVTIARPFAVGKFEVKFEQWDACVADRGCMHRPATIPEWGRGRLPVVNVSWNDITQEYLPWLVRKTGKSYRLLTEAEWEYAARAGTITRYAFGDVITNRDVQHDQWRTAKVGSFAENKFGLHDMHGNVQEWVQDCWHPNYSGAPSDGAAWMTGDCSSRVRRGGDWYLIGLQHLRSASRVYNRSDIGNLTTGFRIARSLTP